MHACVLVLIVCAVLTAPKSPQAVYASVGSLGADKLELRQRLFAGILVVGQGSALRGLNDMLERRVLHALPNHSAVSAVVG